jgi:hypothetical protein
MDISTGQVNGFAGVSQPMNQIFLDFLARVDTYCEQAGMKGYEFGLLVMKDPNFVPDMKRPENPRVPRLSTMDRVDAYMRENPPETLAA